MKEYRYFLSLSSQFPFCGIPLRLDSYSTCQFACRYCFASARGGAVSESGIRIAEPTRLARRFDRIRKLGPRSALDELLVSRVPIHFGGMSDPFMHIEMKTRTTLHLLQILKDNDYPTLISTKGTLLAQDEYVSILRSRNFVVQMSITGLDTHRAAKLDVGVASPIERLAVVRHLNAAGVKTSVRHQPMIPTREVESEELIHRVALSGAKHVSVEYLKLPVETKWAHRNSLSEAVGFDISDFYFSRRAQRIGREWVLPVGDRLPTILKLRSLAHKWGVSFGAADTDLLHMSDGSVCCSGADLLGLGHGFNFNFLSAVRGGLDSGEVSFNHIANSWKPSRSIGQFLNSHSRGGGVTIEEFLLARWNGVTNGPSPLAFFGVFDTDATSSNGLKIYRISDDVRRMTGSLLITIEQPRLPE